MLVFHGDGGGNGRIEMMIRLFLLVVQVLTPFYWTEIGFIREHFKEGRFSIGSLLLFHPPSCIPLVPCHRLLSPPHYSVPTPPPPLSVRIVSLNLQTRLAASGLKYGQHKICLDPKNINNISLDNSRRNTTCLHRDGLIIKKPVVVHSRARISMRNEARRNGRHTGKSFSFRFISPLTPIGHLIFWNH